MSIRFTGLRPIEKNGLKGFGFSVHFDNANSLERGAEQASAIYPITDESSVRSAAGGAHSIRDHAKDRAPTNSGETA